MNLRFALASILVVALGATTLPGCFTNSIIDEFTTDITIPDPGDSAVPFEIRKRYRFSQDPRSAESVELERVTITVVPFEEDLSFIQSATVYVELEDERRIPIARGEGFLPGEQSVEVEILYNGNLADFVRSDNRIVLVWRIEPNLWYGEIPEEGLDLIGKALVEITL